MPLKTIPRLSLADRMKQRQQAKTAPKIEEESPLNMMDITGNTEADDATEVSLIEKKLAGQKQFNSDAFDMAFYIPVVFLSKAQADAFLQQTGLVSCLSVNNGYVDGVAAAKLLNVTLPEAKLHFRKMAGDERLVTEVGCQT